MKTIAILLVVALIFAIIVVAALYLILRAINEENRKKCGTCDFCDRAEALGHCWMRGISVGMEDDACVTYKKRDHEG